MFSSSSSCLIVRDVVDARVLSGDRPRPKYQMGRNFSKMLMLPDSARFHISSSTSRNFDSRLSMDYLGRFADVDIDKRSIAIGLEPRSGFRFED